MKLELYKPYRVRGGWKAVVVDKSTWGDKPLFLVWHEKDKKTKWHWESGCFNDKGNFDLIEEWKEPESKEVYVNLYKNVVDGTLFVKPWLCHGHNFYEGCPCIAQKKITITEGEFED